MGYTNANREEVIRVAIREYKDTIMFWYDKRSLEHCINMMKCVNIMCSIWNTKGLALLRETIEEAEAKLNLFDT